MPDKYGRLFTEADVKRLLEYAVLEGAPRPEEQIAAFDAKGWLTFPADEPVFLLRGKDRTALAALHALLDHLQTAEGVSDDYYTAVHGKAAEFVLFAMEHPDRMKVPD